MSRRHPSKEILRTMKFETECSPGPFTGDSETLKLWHGPVPFHSTETANPTVSHKKSMRPLWTLDSQ